MRELRLRRFAKRPTDVFGELAVVEEAEVLYSCLSLELPWRQNEPGRSCVPAGRYRLAYEYSPAFGRKLWELKDVPGRAEAKLHPANFPEELLGCLAPGEGLVVSQGRWGLSATSRAALARIHALLAGLTETYVTIEDAPWDSKTSLPG